MMSHKGGVLGWATSSLRNLRSGLMHVLFKRPGCDVGEEEISKACGI